MFDGFLEAHAVLVRVIVLMALFSFGCMEAAIFKQRAWACATWFWALAGLTAWIVYPLTLPRVCLGAPVFVAGMAGLVLYYWRWSPPLAGKT